MNEQTTEVVTDADYPALETPDVKVVKHTLYPVSYIDKNGEQFDTIYTWNPGRVAPDYVVGEAFTVETLHPVAMPNTAREGRIAELKAELEKLERQS